MRSQFDFAPIIIFAYNRINHLESCINALKTNDESKFSLLIIYCDGPKNDNDISDVQKVRDYIITITGFKEVQLNISNTNKGLSRSVINGITEQFQKYDKLIILEDDILVSKYFLYYMNSSLELYKDFNNVASIHGYCYPIRNLPSTFFIKGADCWGWATWKRSWNEFEFDGKILLDYILDNKLKYEFNLFGAYNYTKMLKNQILKKNDSWAIRWHASNFILNKLTLYPGKSLVKNIGIDGSGTNFISSDFSFETTFYNSKTEINFINIKENKRARNCFAIFFYKRKIKALIKKLIKF
jgi:hypothetical protein